MSAFANSKGGVIIFGVDDSKEIIGVESEKGEIELITTASKFYSEPEIQFTYEVVFIKGVDVVVVNVPESKTKPHKIVSEQNGKNPKYFIRQGEKSVLASRETVGILRNSNNNKPFKLNFGEIEKSLFRYLDENEKITLKGFKRLVNISERRASRILVNLVRAEVIRHHNNGYEEFFTLP